MLDSELPSPSFVIDLSRAISNTERMRAKGVSLRPHVKTHKTLEGSKLQVGNDSDARIVVSTLKEAEFFSDTYGDILYGVLLEPSKYERAWNLHVKMPSFSVLLDSTESIETFSNFIGTQISKFSDQGSDDFLLAARRFNVFLAVDSTGYKREGIALGDSEIQIEHPVVSAALAITKSRRLRFAGIYSHSGNSYNTCSDQACSSSTAASTSTLSSHVDARANALSVAERERDLMMALSSRLQTTFNIAVPVVSIGATPSSTALVAKMEKEKTSAGSTPQFELHPGNYIFYDRQQVESGSCTLNDIACYVVARVLARYPERNEFLIDAGGCALHKDLAGLHDGTYGCLLEDSSLVITKLTQEVAVVGRIGGEKIDLTNFPPGKVVRVYPNHSCMTASCHDVFHVVDGESTSDMSRHVIDKWIPVKFW